MKLLKGKKAIITGGSEGIGYAIAEAFVKNGADVILISRSKGKLKKAKEKLSVYNQNIYVIPFDLSNVSNITSLVIEIKKCFAKVDILVNNAAMAIFEKIENMDPADLAQIINTNIQFPYLLTQKLIPALRETKGTIINISSYFSKRMIAGRYSTAYSLTKGAMDSFTKSLACELGSQGIRVNAIAPGSVKTSLFNKAIEEMTNEKREEFKRQVKTIYPLGRVGEPSDLGGVALFLASEQAKWMTGSIVNVDGGLTTN